LEWDVDYAEIVAEMRIIQATSVECEEDVVGFVEKYGKPCAYPGKWFIIPSSSSSLGVFDL
jgi:hypothetical protein